MNTTNTEVLVEVAGGSDMDTLGNEKLPTASSKLPTYELSECDEDEVIWLNICFGNFTYTTGFCIANIDHGYRQAIMNITDDCQNNITPWFEYGGTNGGADGAWRVAPYLNLANYECDGIPLDLFQRFAEAIRKNEKRTLISDCVQVGSENKLVNETGQLILDIRYYNNSIEIYTLPNSWASQMTFSIGLTTETSGATANMFDEIHDIIADLAMKKQQQQQQPMNNR